MGLLLGVVSVAWMPMGARTPALSRGPWRAPPAAPPSYGNGMRGGGDGDGDGDGAESGNNSNNSNVGERAGGGGGERGDCGTTTVNSRVVDSEYVVMFKSYMTVSQHISILESYLGSEGWELIPRNNPAYIFPSDFALIKVRNSGLLKPLLDSRQVRHVIPQRMYTLDLKEACPTDATPINFNMAYEDTMEIATYESRIGAGRPHTDFPDMSDINLLSQRTLLATTQITDAFNTRELWDLGITGAGIKVAIFDTGLEEDHPHFKFVEERTNWTDEPQLDDVLGHGTLVAGVIASQDECYGFAPDSHLYIFRVFNKNRVSYTSWFLDAFNYAMKRRIHLLNLSIGGPDFSDIPFIEKVWEMSASGIVVVSAIGNDGPAFGTDNNPADQYDVIGVGGMDWSEQLAKFSSRGMTLWEIPQGYGRMKPDVVAYADRVEGSKIKGGCRVISGTSVAAPVVTGMLSLLASSLLKNGSEQHINPAAMKQVLLESGEHIYGYSIFEQGSGKINLHNAFENTKKFQPHLSLSPSVLDLTDCPLMWPYCSQPMYYSAMPVVANVTILNSNSVVGFVKETAWHPGIHGDLLEISVTNSLDIWPWSGWLGIRMRVTPLGATYEGSAEGVLTVTVSSPSQNGNTEERHSVNLPIRVNIIPTPARHTRILWDQFHSLQYPLGFFPRDVINKVVADQFDWNGDHPHTNFNKLYMHLRDLNYFVEVLSEPFTCFDAEQYGTLLIVDPEDEFAPAEVNKIYTDVMEHRLSLIVFSDWFNLTAMEAFKFLDGNTRSWWTPITGGANVPSINNLLEPWGIALGSSVFEGKFNIQDKTSMFLSGNSIARFPSKGALVTAALLTDVVSGKKWSNVPVLGVLRVPLIQEQLQSSMPSSSPIIAVFGDSSCLDTALKQTPSCLWLLEDLLRLEVGTETPAEFIPSAVELTEAYEAGELPRRPEPDALPSVSHTVDRTLICNSHKWESKPGDSTLRIQFPQRSSELFPGGFDRHTKSLRDTYAVADDIGEVESSHLILYILLSGLGLAFVAMIYFNRRTNSIDLVEELDDV
ncbi:membrane-bound transcription factor site-1 protease [Pelomyxa schiedti]|nr:membrane-bound transcription factor site-1 protease [Pelomyxa schiedti]